MRSKLRKLNNCEIKENNKNSKGKDDTTDKIELILKSKILDVANKILTLMATAFGVVVAIFVPVKNIGDMFYRLECENYYNIPKKYFSIDNSNIYETVALILLLVICIFALIAISSYFVRKGINKKIVQIIFNLFVCLFLALTFVLIMIAFFLSFIENYFSDISNVLVVVFICTLIFFCVFFICGILFAEKIINNAIKNQKVLVVVCGAWIVSFAFVIFVILGGIYSIYDRRTNIDKETKYEKVIYENDSYIILSEIEKDKVLVVPYIVDNNNWSLCTYKYLIIENKNLEISYIDMPTPPQIIKNADITDDLNNENTEN